MGSGSDDPAADDRAPSAGAVQHGYEVRVTVDGQAQLWAVTRGRSRSRGDEDAANWSDWNAAAFMPLEQLDAELARDAAAVLVDEFLSRGGLSARRRGEALASLRLRRGVTPRGQLILGADLPLGAGHPTYGWDGSREAALEIARSMGEVAGDTISAERNAVGPTGWEPELDATPEGD